MKYCLLSPRRENLPQPENKAAVLNTRTDKIKQKKREKKT